MKECVRGSLLGKTVESEALPADVKAGLQSAKKDPETKFTY